MQLTHFEDIMLSVGSGPKKLTTGSPREAKRRQNQLLEARVRYRDGEVMDESLTFINSIVVSVRGNDVILETSSSIRAREMKELETKLGHKDERATTQS